MENRMSTPVFSTRSNTPMHDMPNAFSRPDISMSSIGRSNSALSSRHSESSFRHNETSFRRSESSLSRFPKVEGNISKDDSLKLYNMRKRIQRDPHKAISIDESPIMLLPKARMRTDFDLNHVNRRFFVVPQEDFTSFHLSTFPFSPPPDTGTPRTFSRLSFKSRRHSRSDADSGFGSMKRCVTFDELSIGFSTISKSLDDIERVSNSEESIRGCDNNNEQEPEIHTIILDDGEEAPEYIDNFADDVFAVPIPPKIPKKSEKRECSLTEADIERCHQQSCEICKGFMDERQRIQRYFGGIESFLDWLFSKWGKRKELTSASRPASLRGRRPRFCNIVRQKELHERDKGESPTFRDADYDYYRQHANGPLISRWRKHSQARQAFHPRSKSDEGGTEGRPGSPSSHAGDDGEDKENRLQSNRASPTPVDTGTIVPTIIDFPERKPQPVDGSKNKTISTPVSTRSLNDDIQNTPVQPPPTPEPASPKEEKSLSPARIPQETEGDREQRETDTDKDAQGNVEKESKKRAPIQKKERKPVERIRKTKPEMEVKDKPIGATPPPVPKTEPEESKAKDITVELDLPSLPTVEPEKKKKREKKKPEKHLISQPKYEEQPKQDPEAAIDEEIKQRIKTFEMNIADMGVGDESPRKVVAKPAWVTGRLALSQQSSRFELPMDIVRLENMSPLDYIKEFCIITRRRKKLYSDIFSKHKDSTKANTIPVKELERAVKSVLVNTITTEHYKELADMLEIDENTRIDIATFSAISALAERLLCTSFMVSRDQVDMPQKEDIECADFSALDWKLNGVHVKPQMYKLLKQLS